MTVYVASTMTADVEYRLTEQVKQSAKEKERDLKMPKVLSVVTIKGGANLGQLPGIMTPKGIVTPVADEAFEWLIKDAAFLRHKERGFITIHEKEIKGDAAAMDMKHFDGSAPNNVEEGNTEDVPHSETA